MNDKTYHIVGLDGQEYKDIEYALIREWYAARLVNEESLVFDHEIGQWKKLLNVFNLAELNTARNLLMQQNAANYQNNQQTFHDPVLPANPPPTFNQNFPPNRNFNADKPKSSSGWKIALGIIGVIILVFAGIAGAGAYFFSRIAETQAFKQASSAGREKFVAELKNYEIPGSEYVEEKSGAKVLLPKEWRMLKPDNPLLPVFNRNEINNELEKDGISETMMLATDKLANQVLLTEVIHFPNRVDNVAFFNQSIKLVEQELTKQSEQGTYQTHYRRNDSACQRFSQKSCFRARYRKKEPENGRIRNQHQK